MSLIHNIKREYGIDIVTMRSHRDVYRIQTSRHGVLCLKSYANNDEVVKFVGEVHQHLNDCGFPFSPRTLLTRNHQLFTSVSSRCWMLTNWVNGNPPRFPTQLKQSVATLARFHRYAKNLSVSTVPSGRFKVYSLEDRLQRTYTVMKSKYTGRLRDELTELCEASLVEAKTSAVRQAVEHEFNQKAFVHGDYNYPNIVVDAKGRHHLIDFDNSSYEVRMEDLAHIIHRNHPWNIDGILRMIEWYDRVRPIRQNDLRLLRVLLYEPYPVLRAIRQRRLHTRQFQSMLPTRGMLQEFSKGLDKFI